jgi:hypothetical protein
MVGGSVKEGTIVVLSLQKPMPLFEILKTLPPVEQVVRDNKKIMVKLKPSTTA